MLPIGNTSIDSTAPIISPISLGCFRPRIILSKAMNTDDKQLLPYVLTHEDGVGTLFYDGE